MSETMTRRVERIENELKESLTRLDAQLAIEQDNLVDTHKIARVRVNISEAADILEVEL